MSVERLDEAFERSVRDAYHRPVPMRPLDERELLHALAMEPPPVRQSWWRGAPGLTLSLPAAVAAAAALVVAGVLAGAALERRALVTPPAAQQVVHFALLAPRASSVAVVGDFNGWDPVATPMRKLRSGATWTAEISVPEGQYVYAFVIDGRTWMPDPTAPLAPGDGFGHESSVLVVPPGRSSS